MLSIFMIAGVVFCAQFYVTAKMNMVVRELKEVIAIQTINEVEKELMKRQLTELVKLAGESARPENVEKLEKIRQIMSDPSDEDLEAVARDLSKSSPALKKAIQRLSAPNSSLSLDASSSPPPVEPVDGVKKVDGGTDSDSASERSGW
jgi:hypothetical protein